MITIKSRTFSYLSGLPDREFQEKIWRIWANAAEKIFELDSGRMKPKGLRFNGKAHAVLSFIAEVVSFVEYGEELPFEEFYVPENMLSWPEIFQGMTISGPDDFFANILEMYGVSVSNNFDPDHLVVVVDPHLLSGNLSTLCNQLKGRHVLVLTEERRPLPQPFRELLFDSRTDMQVMHWSTLGPLSLPAVRDAARNTNTSGITVVGAGRRLPIAILQSCDLRLLFKTDPVFDYKSRRQVVRDEVTLHTGYAEFPTDWYNGETELHSGFLAYLQGLGCSTYPLPAAQISPNEVDVEFLVKGHLVPA